MLRDLRAAMALNRIEVADVVDHLGITTGNFHRKIAETVPFTRDEMYALRDEYFPGMLIDDLFNSDGCKPTEAESLHAQVEAMGDAMRHAVGGNDPEVDEIEGMFHDCVNEWERQKGGAEA